MRALVSPGRAPGLAFSPGRGSGTGGGVIGPISGGVTGIVTNSVGGAAVAGGTVWLVRGGSVVDTDVPNGSGVYSFSSVQAADVVFNNPPLAYSVADAGQFTVNPGDTKNFSLLPVGTGNSVDFQSFTSDTDVQNIGSSGPNGCFWDNNIDIGTAGGHGGSVVTPAQIKYDATGGPLGDKCVRYDFPIDTTPGPNIRLEPHLKIGDVTGDLWIRFLDKVETGWSIGGNGQSGSACEYKWCFIEFIVQTSGGPNAANPQIQIEWESGGSGTPPPSGRYLIRIKYVDYNDGGNPTAFAGYSAWNTAYGDRYPSTFFGPIGHDIAVGAVPPADGFDGEWHSHVMGLVGLGEVDEPSLYYYLDGVLIATLTGPFIPSQGVWGRSAAHPSYSHLADSGNQLAVQMGANMNNGPDAPQSRYIREFGIYRSRPSLVAGVAV